MRTNQLLIKDIGPFDECRIAFPAQKPEMKGTKADITILTGPNGSGKSTALYAVAGAIGSWQNFHGVPHIFRRFRGETALVAISTSEGQSVFRAGHRPQTALISSPFNDGTVLNHSGSTNSNGIFYQWSSSGLPSAGVANYQQQVSRFSVKPTTPSTPRFSFAAFAYAGSRTLNEYKLDGIREPADSPFSGALSFTHTADASRLANWIANTDAREAMALRDKDAASAQRYSHALRSVENIISEVVGEAVAFKVSHKDSITVTLDRAGVRTDLDLLPDGLKSIVAWVADLLMRLDRIPWEGDIPVTERPFLLLLDEIDIHLHPAWQRRVLPMIQRLFPNAQVIVSTHSPFVVGSVSDAWVIPLEIKDGKACAGNPVEASADKSYSAILRSIFGVEKEFGEETEKALDAFYALKHDVLAKTKPLSELRQAAETMASHGTEVQSIISMELRQAERQSSQEVR